MSDPAETAPLAPLFLPCAAGVEALLADEVARILPGRARRAQRGGVALQGSVADAMALNLESRLAQRVLVEVAEGPYRHENDVYELARGVDWSLWIGPRQTLRVDTTTQRSPLKSPKFAALRLKDAVCDQFREEQRRAPRRRHAPARPAAGAAPRAGARDDLRRHLGRAAVQARLARGHRRRAAQGDARRRAARRRRLARHARGRRRAARPVLRRRHHRHRGGADRLRHRAGAAPRLRLRAAGAVPARRGARRVAAHEGRGALARARQRGADPRQRRVVPHGRLRAPQRRARRRRATPSSSTAATRWSARRRRCRRSCPARWSSTRPTASASSSAAGRRRGRADGRPPATTTTAPCPTTSTPGWPRTGSAPTRGTPPAGPPGCSAPT